MKSRIGLGALVCTVFAFGCADAPSSKATLSPARWPDGELEKYTELGRNGDPLHHVAEGTKGMIVSTNEALAIRAGLEALKQGGTAADAAITTSLTQISMAAGCWVSYAGIMTMIYYEAETGRVHSMNAAFNTVREEDDPLSIPPPGNPSGRTALVPGFMRWSASDQHGMMRASGKVAGVLRSTGFDQKLLRRNGPIFVFGCG